MRTLVSVGQSLCSRAECLRAEGCWAVPSQRAGSQARARLSQRPRSLLEPARAGRYGHGEHRLRALDVSPRLTLEPLADVPSMSSAPAPEETPQDPAAAEPAAPEALGEALAATHLDERAGAESSPEGALTPAAQDSTLSAASARSKSPGTKTFRRIGTELLEMVSAARPAVRVLLSSRTGGAAHARSPHPPPALQKTLSKEEQEESAERLSKPKEVVKASTVRPKAVQLKYKYNKELRGGKGGFAEMLVPAKSSSKEEKQVPCPRPPCASGACAAGTAAHHHQACSWPRRQPGLG